MTESRYPYVHVDVPAEDSDEISFELWELGAQGVEERDDGTLVRAGEGRVELVASFIDDEAAEEARAALADRYTTRVEHVVGDAWADAWKQYFKPTHFGARLVVRPSWEPYEPLPHEVVLVLDPGRAFGSGLHETTRHIMRLLDAHVKGGEAVLDVGCGSGILGLAALLLGASRVVATDVDPDSVIVTRENAELNGLTDRVEATDTSIQGLDGAYPLVLANIEARVLVPLARPIAARVAPGGLLLLSGILRGQEEEVLGAYTGFETLEIPVDGEWVAIALRRPA
jgi:ribosomal protein L11 methyltransferase